jgi:hypothetical protein
MIYDSEITIKNLMLFCMFSAMTVRLSGNSNKYKRQHSENQSLNNSEEYLQEAHSKSDWRKSVPMTITRMAPPNIELRRRKENEIIFANSEISSSIPTKISTKGKITSKADLNPS